MKLVYRILLHLSWALSLLLAAWAVLFYFTLIDEINDEVDDALEARAEVIVKRVLAGRELPVPADEGNNGYFLHEVSPQYAAAQHHERYSDEEIFIPERDDKEPARVLRKLFRDGAGQWRELTVMTPTIEKDDLRESILRWMVCLYLFLLLMILLVTVIVLYRTMRPLYALLRWLDGYTVGARNAPLAVETSVTEFRKLNDAARRYAERAESSFERQKQFIGNASHEMQTPLAVCRNRLEMLVDDAHALTGGAVGRDRQGAADAGLPRAAQPFAAAAVEDRQRPVPRGRRGRRERTGAPHGRGHGGDLRLPQHALCARGRGAAHGADESVAGRERGRQPAEKRIRSRRRGRRGDGARRSASLHGLQQRCGRSARRRAYLRPVLSGNEEGGFYGAGPCRGRRSLPSLRVEGVLFL